MPIMKTAIVTGGNTGMGEAIARTLLEADYRVVSLALDLPEFEHQNLIGMQFDLSRQDDIEKAAQIGMVRTWALELGPCGITVNAIAPGPVPTTMFRDVIQGGSEEENNLVASLPMRRLGRTDDIARSVMYFVEPDNDFVTGQTLFVCGGASVGSLKI